MSVANTTIRIRKSLISGNVPSSLANGEIAINAADDKLFYAKPSGVISYITNQQSFATVNANSSLILASSSTDTLTIVPGNNISITACTTTKTITIASTASGGSGVAGSSVTSSRLFYTATNGQTVFTTPTYTIGANQTRLYVNGVRQYSSTDYNETSTTSITLTSGCQTGDSVMIEVDGYVTVSTSGNQVINSSRQFYTATAGQTLFSTPYYNQGLSQLRVYVNGVRQYNSEYTETSPTSVTLSSGCSSGDSVLIEVDGYAVIPDTLTLTNLYTTGNVTVNGTISFTNTLLVANLNADLLDGQHGTYYSPTTFTQAAFDKANTDVTSISITSTTYGNSSHHAVITASANGRIASISNTLITIDASQIGSGIIDSSRLASGTANANTYLRGDGTWSPLSSSSSDTSPININSNTVSTSLTISSGTNGLSVGPMNIIPGQSVVVSPNQRWIIL